MKEKVTISFEINPEDYSCGDDKQKPKVFELIEAMIDGEADWPDDLSIKIESGLDFQ